MAAGGLDLGAPVTSRLPFQSPALAAAALAIVVGLPMACTAYRASTGRARTGELAMLAGALLVGWIGVQLVVIGTVSWRSHWLVPAWNRRPRPGSGLGG